MQTIAFRTANRTDLELIHRMQVECFLPLLEKYGDSDTNPAAESPEDILRRFEMACSTYHFILLGIRPVGAIRIVTDAPGTTARISPMFVLPDYQGRGIGYRALELAGLAYPTVVRWELDTIGEEASLCRFYERAGFKRTGHEEIIRPGMTIRFYEK